MNSRIKKLVIVSILVLTSLIVSSCKSDTPNIQGTQGKFEVSNSEVGDLYIEDESKPKEYVVSNDIVISKSKRIDANTYSQTIFETGELVGNTKFEQDGITLEFTDIYSNRKEPIKLNIKVTNNTEYEIDPLYPSGVVNGVSSFIGLNDRVIKPGETGNWQFTISDTFLWCAGMNAINDIKILNFDISTPNYEPVTSFKDIYLQTSVNNKQTRAYDDHLIYSENGIELYINDYFDSYNGQMMAIPITVVNNNENSEVYCEITDTWLNGQVVDISSDFSIDNAFNKYPACGLIMLDSSSLGRTTIQSVNDIESISFNVRFDVTPIGDYDIIEYTSDVLNVNIQR